MKSRISRVVTATFLCLSALTVSSGCTLFDPHKMIEKMVQENQKKREEQMRQITEAQNQRITQQREQEKIKATQMAQVSEPKKELPSVKEQEPPKTESVAQVTDIKQEISEKKKEADDQAPRDAYGSNDAATPLWFVNLPPEKKAALHWVAAQEYMKLHNTVDHREAGILAELHRTTTDEIIIIMQMPKDKRLANINALPHKPKPYEKWRAAVIEKHNTTEGLRNAMAALDQAQKDEQINKWHPAARRGCEWMTGNYYNYQDHKLSSLCTPVIGACVKGNCNNGHGTYISFDGSKFVGEFKQGHATTPDPDYATVLRLAEQGDAAAQFKLGKMYKNGYGIPQDYRQALYWYRKAADQGFAKAQDSLGLLYAEGDGVPQSYAQAMAWWRKAADQGLANSQHNLGVLYDRGNGVPRDYEQAAAWYSKAAEQGYDLSQVNLGILYDRGNGVPKNYAAAVFWYRQAAAQGNEDAQYNLRALSSDIAGGLLNGMMGGGSTNERGKDSLYDKEFERQERLIQRNEKRAREEDLKQRQEDTRKYNEDPPDGRRVPIPEH